MSKYKAGDKFIVEVVTSLLDDGWYGVLGFGDLIIPGSALDKLVRYSGSETASFEPPRRYRTWQELIKEPADMTPDEKERLKRIKAIPPVAFDAAREQEKYLRERIMQLEKEHDELCDFLNGEV